MDLPIHPFREGLVDAVGRFQALLVVGETGSGKTTQLPQFIHSAGLHADGDRRLKIGVTQPRRVAAVSVATRVAEEMRCSLGGLVGYRIRFDDRTSADTQIQYMTDGVLLRECIDDPLLSAYKVIVLDEAHERSLETDILFGFLKLVLSKRPDLKLVVMSATLDVKQFSAYFDNCPIFEIPGRTFDVDIFYNEYACFTHLHACFIIFLLTYVCLRDMDVAHYATQFTTSALSTVLHIHEKDSPGDILVFLTGSAEIEDFCRRLERAHASLDYRLVEHRDVRDMLVLPLYGALEADLQRAIFDRPPRGTRKVVVCTNIAATSVTIDGIRYVVDAGLVKQKEYDAKTGMDALAVTRISKAAAEQRAGRAGRTAHGKCYRLFSRAFFESMPDATVPEIQRTSLAATVLVLKQVGVDDVLAFQFMERPDTEMLVSALKQLFLLGALDARGAITDVGHAMIQFPLAPQLARALIAGAHEGCGKDMATLAAMLSVEDVFVKPRGGRAQEADKAREGFSDQVRILNKGIMIWYHFVVFLCMYLSFYLFCSTRSLLEMTIFGHFPVNFPFTVTLSF